MSEFTKPLSGCTGAIFLFIGAWLSRMLRKVLKYWWLSKLAVLWGCLIRSEFRMSSLKSVMFILWIFRVLTCLNLQGTSIGILTEKVMARWSDSPAITLAQSAFEKVSLTHMTSNIWPWMCVGESIILVKLYWQRESLNFCDQPSCLSRCRFKSPNITFSQHDKAAPSTKELKSSMKLALETLGGLYTVWKTISWALPFLRLYNT